MSGWAAGVAINPADGLLPSFHWRREMNMNWLGMALVAIVAVLILLVQHWGPWQQLIGGKRWHPTANYVQGVLALLVPLTALWIVEGSWREIAATWLVTISGGLAVMAAYAIDEWLNARVQSEISQQEAMKLRPGVGDDTGQAL